MKPKQILLLVSSVINLSCYSPVKHPINNKKLVSKKSGYLDWDSVKINGRIPMLSNFKTVLSILGKPDSITNTGDDDSSLYFHKSKCYYINGIQFEKENDSLVFRRIDFRRSKEAYLTIEGIKFTTNTTFDNFRKLFPYAENTELSGTDMDKNQWIRLPTSSNNKSGDAWDFLFDRNTGKLISIDYRLDD